MIPPEWKVWPEKVVITGNDERESLWAGQFKGLSLIHYDLLQLLKSKIFVFKIFGFLSTLLTILLHCCYCDCHVSMMMAHGD